MNFQILASGQSFHDDEISGLMAAADYQQVIKLTKDRLKHISAKETQKQSYYLNQLGFAYFRLGSFDSAYACGLQVLHFKVKKGDSVLVADNWRLMAYVYNRKGRFDSALYYSYKLLGYANRHNNLIMKGNALTSLSTILMQNKRYREALKFNSEAYALYLKTGDTASQAAAEYNIGLAYLNLKEPDSSLIYLYKGLKTNEKKHKWDIDAHLLDAIAECYFQKGNIRLWKDYLQKSIKAAEKSGNPYFAALRFSQLGQHALLENDLGMAARFLLGAHHALLSQPYPALQVRVDSMLYIVAKKQNNHPEALKWLESYTALQSRLLNAKQLEELNGMIIKIETQERRLQLEQKELEMSRMHQKLTVMISGISFLFLLLAGILAYLFRIQRYRKTLYYKNIELDRQLKLAEQLMESQSNADVVTMNEPPEHVESPPGISNNKNLDIYKQLTALLENRKLFLDPDLNVKTVQTELGTNKKYLYEAINKYSGTNFRGLINRYRVNEVRKKFEGAIQNEGVVSINQIALGSGFNSYTSFYRIFRQFTGLTPNEYLLELRKEKSHHKKQEPPAGE